MSSEITRRFNSPARSFRPEVLLKELHKYLVLSAILAVLIHLCAAIIDPLEETVETTPRPLTTKFIKREPRLTKPLELRKVPKPKRQMIQRQTTTTRARMDQVKATASFNTISALNMTASFLPIWKASLLLKFKMFDLTFNDEKVSIFVKIPSISEGKNG